ncbi:MAG: type II secretion system F family protein [Clostridia bacterium]|nr:type II secretion system F family protein [Clostridia bacterium]
MQLVVLFAAITVFLLITGLLYPEGVKRDQLSRRLERIKNSNISPEIFDEELKKPLSERLLTPLKNSFLNNLRRLVPGSQRNRNSKSWARTMQSLHGADLDLSYEEFSLIKIGTAILLCLAGVFIAQALRLPLASTLLIAFIGLTLGMWLPMLIVTSKEKRRNAKILHDMPEIMDLLVVSVEAGLGLDAAITRLYERNRSPLIVELMKTVRDAQMGLPRRESLKAMGERCNVPELRAFAAALIQAEQLGVSIKKVLFSQADQLRMSYRQRCEARAAKAPIKMMLPMVIFIFPVIFIILLGPSIPQIMSIFQ